MHVPIGKFRGRLTAYLRLVGCGRQLVLTSKGHPVATVQAVMKAPEGLPFIAGVAWSKGKPDLPAHLADLPRANKPVAELIAAERRWRLGR